jgi:hypothetical protein
MTLVTALTFAAVASPAAFKVTRGFFGDWVASPEGLATIPGLLLHAVVFMFLVKLIWNLMGPKKEKFRTRKDQQVEEYKHWSEAQFLN